MTFIFLGGDFFGGRISGDLIVIFAWEFGTQGLRAMFREVPIDGFLSVPPRFEFVMKEKQIDDFLEILLTTSDCSDFISDLDVVLYILAWSSWQAKRLFVENIRFCCSILFQVHLAFMWHLIKPHFLCATERVLQILRGLQIQVMWRNFWESCILRQSSQVCRTTSSNLT